MCDRARDEDENHTASREQPVSVGSSDGSGGTRKAL